MDKIIARLNELQSRIALLEEETGFLRGYIFEHARTVLLPKCYVKVNGINSLEIITPDEYERLDEQDRAGYSKMGIDIDENGDPGDYDSGELDDININTEMWHTHYRFGTLPIPNYDKKDANHGKK